MIPAGIISADGHVCEPANCYVDHIDPQYRDRAPYITTLDDGTDAFIVPGMKKPVALGFIDGAGFTPTQRLARAKTMKFSDVRPAAYLGRERIPYTRSGASAHIAASQRLYAFMQALLYSPSRCMKIPMPTDA